MPPLFDASIETGTTTRTTVKRKKPSTPTCVEIATLIVDQDEYFPVTPHDSPFKSNYDEWSPESVLSDSPSSSSSSSSCYEPESTVVTVKHEYLSWVNHAILDWVNTNLPLCVAVESSPFDPPAIIMMRHIEKLVRLQSLQEQVRCAILTDSASITSAADLVRVIDNVTSSSQSDLRDMIRQEAVASFSKNGMQAFIDNTCFLCYILCLLAGMHAIVYNRNPLLLVVWIPPVLISLVQWNRSKKSETGYCQIWLNKNSSKYNNVVNTLNRERNMNMTVLQTTSPYVAFFCVYLSLV